MPWHSPCHDEAHRLHTVPGDEADDVYARREVLGTPGARCSVGSETDTCSPAGASARPTRRPSASKTSNPSSCLSRDVGPRSAVRRVGADGQAEARALRGRCLRNGIEQPNCCHERGEVPAGPGEVATEDDQTVGGRAECVDSSAGDAIAARVPGRAVPPGGVAGRGASHRRERPGGIEAAVWSDRDRFDLAVHLAAQQGPPRSVEPPDTVLLGHPCVELACDVESAVRRRCQVTDARGTRIRADVRKLAPRRSAPPANEVLP